MKSREVRSIAAGASWTSDEIIVRVVSLGEIATQKRGLVVRFCRIESIAQTAVTMYADPTPIHMLCREEQHW